MEKVQNYEKQIAARIAYLRYLKEHTEFVIKGSELYSELEYLARAYGDNATINNIIEEMLDSDHNDIIIIGTGEYSVYEMLPNESNEVVQPMKRKYELKVREQYATGRCLNYEFEDIDKMVDFIKQTIKHSVPVVVFEFKAIETGE